MTALSKFLDICNISAFFFEKNYRELLHIFFFFKKKDLLLLF